MRLIADVLRKRIPTRAEIQLIFSLVVFIVFGWAIWIFLYELPAYLVSSHWGGIISQLLVRMASALFESLLITSLLVLLSFVLPSKWFRIGFSYKGFITLLVMVILTFWIRDVFVNDDQFPPMDLLYKGGGILFSAWVALLFMIHRWTGLQRMVKGLLERIEVFLYIYLPLGLIGLGYLLLINVVD